MFEKHIEMPHEGGTGSSLLLSPSSANPRCFPAHAPFFIFLLKGV